jgi:hypothetical protein
MTQQLDGEERVSISFAVHDARDLGGAGVAEHLDHECSDLVGTESFDRHAFDATDAMQFGEDVVQVGGGFAVADSRNQEQSRKFQDAKQVTQQQQRAAIGPLKVVDDHHDWRLGQRDLEQSGHRSEQQIPVGGVRRGSWRWHATHPVDEFWHQHCEITAVTTDVVIEGTGWRMPDQVTQHRGKGLIRRAEFLVAAPVQDDGAVRMQLARRLGDQSTLAGARLAGDEVQLSLPVSCVLRSAKEPVYFGCSPH